MSDRENQGEEAGAPLDDGELDAWEPQLPPANFADRVMSGIGEHTDSPSRREEAKPPANAVALRARSRWRGAAVAAAVMVAIAAVVVVKVDTSAGHGEAIAADRRMEIAVGSRAKAVLEPDAHVAWDGDLVTQESGDVFYRVEPGARFRVHTPAGDVDVKGTCFTVKVRGGGLKQDGSTDMQKRDMKSGVVGAALSAIAFVAVYEGKVAVSHASEHVDLAAGESAQLGPGGATKNTSAELGKKAFDENVAAQESDPLSIANGNLVSQVQEYKQRLDALAAQKADVEKKLDSTEKKLASATDGGPPRNRSEYELSADEWADLAKRGKIKYRTPCMKPDKWNTPVDKLTSLGLSPEDGATLKGAYGRSYDRVWGMVRPLCLQALGTSEAIVDKIGVNQCIHLVYDLAAQADQDGTSEAHIQVAEIRAGSRQAPPPDKQVPTMRMMLALTGEQSTFEADLAKSFGPEEAHRIAWSDDICVSNNSWGTAPRGSNGAKK